MDHQSLIIIPALAVLVCAVYSLYLDWQDEKKWRWYTSATIGGGATYLLCIALARFFALSAQLTLILGLALATLLYALTVLLYMQKGISMKEKYRFVVSNLAAIVFIALTAHFTHQEFLDGPLAVFLAYFCAITAIRLPGGTRK